MPRTDATFSTEHFDKLTQLTAERSAMETRINLTVAENVALKSRIEQLERLNMAQINTIHNLSVLQTSVTARITSANAIASKVINSYFQDYPILIELQQMETTIPFDLIMVKLSTLLHTWSRAQSFEDFLPLADPISQTQTRPIFTIKNLMSALDNNMNTVRLCSLLYKYSTSLWYDQQAFPYLRNGYKHKSPLHAYIAIAATCFVWQIARGNRIVYHDAPVALDFTSEDYQAIMATNMDDISFSPEPPRFSYDTPTTEPAGIRLSMSNNSDKKRKNR